MLPILRGELFRDLIQKLPDAILIVNQKGIIESTNSKVHSVFGYFPHELAGKELEILVPSPSESIHKKMVQGYFKNPIDKKMGKHRTVMGKRKDGTEFEIDITLSSLNLENNLYAIASCRSIEDKKDKEQEMEVEIYNLQMINKGLEQYNYSVSHDLKSPLVKIEGLLNLLVDEVKNGKSSEQLEQLFGYLKESIVSMKDMINAILEDARKRKQEEGNLTLEAIFKEVKKLIEIPSRFDITISSKCQSIPGIKSELIQVFLNLLSNSIKFNDKEKGFVEVTCIEHQHEYLFTFTDNGQGIHQDKLGKIFELFEKGATGKQSHGIGLYTIKSIVESRGGTIKVDTKLGEGTTFLFNWPKLNKNSEEISG